MRLTRARQRAEKSHRTGVEELVCLWRLSHDLNEEGRHRRSFVKTHILALGDG